MPIYVGTLAKYAGEQWRLHIYARGIFVGHYGNKCVECLGHPHYFYDCTHKTDKMSIKQHSQVC